MALTPQFWQMCRIVPGSNSRGYSNQKLPVAQAFLEQPTMQAKVQSLEAQDVAIALLTDFQQQSEAVLNRAQAGLCLRCWVSHPILRACIKVANLFGAAKQFTYRDLLPFVLNDDGRQLIIPADAKSYSVVNKSGGKASLPYSFFSLEVLRTYRLDKTKRLSLTNWVYLQTKQHPELKTYLADFGFRNLSDWALLNRARPQQLEQLSEQDCALVAAFHQVYRRDRRREAKVSRCPDPTPEQLSEMLTLLQSAPLAERDLLQRLKQAAVQLRQFDIWQSREPLEYFDAEAGQYQTRADLPAANSTADAAEEQALLSDLQQQLKFALHNSLRSVLDSRIAQLKKSSKYSAFADQFTTGLRSYYRDGLSLKEIAPMLGMTSRDQARRVLNPGDFLGRVRAQTIQQLLDQILDTVKTQAIAPWPPTPVYLQQLSEQLEAFADAEVFQAAAAEMKSGSYRTLDSDYAQLLLLTLDSYSPS